MLFCIKHEFSIHLFSAIEYLETAVPVQQLEHCHELLELQHGSSAVGLEHKAERSDPRVRVVYLQLMPMLESNM